MIGYQDFFPAVVKRGMLSTQYEALPAAVLRANEWIDRTGVRVINVETVVLPNVREAENASQTAIRTSGEMSSYWYQVVRVWYEPEPPKD